MARTGRGFPSHQTKQHHVLAAVTSVTYNYTSTGGITFGGSATTKIVYVPLISGGIVFAGTATTKLIKTHIATGGIVFAGSATTTKVSVHTSTGGVVFAGSANVNVTYAPTSTGGIIFGGSASTKLIKLYTSSGGIIFAGSATVKKVYVFSSSGGIIFAGNATVIKVQSHVGSGGIVFGGSATMTLILTTPTLAQVEGATRNEIFKRFLRETGLGTYGIVTGVSGGATTTFDDTTRLKSTQFNSRDWQGAWARIAKNADALSTAPENEVMPITTYDPTTNGRITAPTFTGSIAVGDEYELWRFPNPKSVIDDLDVILREDIYLPCWSILSEAPDFDMEQNNTTDWTAGANTTLSKASGEPSLDGARWLALSTNSNAGSAYNSNAIYVEPGKKYFVSVVAYNPNGATLTLEAYDVSNNVTIDSVTWDRRYPGRMHFEFMTPSTCHSLRIYLRHSNVGGSQTSYWDELCLYPTDAYDIALPWWIKSKNQIKAVFKLSPIDINNADVWDSALRGEFFNEFEIRDNAFGRGQLRLVMSHGTLPGILFIFGVRNEVAYINDNADTKRLDENLVVAALATKVFRRLKTFPNSNAMQTTWIERQYTEWEKKYKQLTIQQSQRVEEITQTYRAAGQFIDSRFAFNR